MPHPDRHGGWVIERAFGRHRDRVEKRPATTTHCGPGSVSNLEGGNTVGENSDTTKITKQISFNSHLSLISSNILRPYSQPSGFAPRQPLDDAARRETSAGTNPAPANRW